MLCETQWSSGELHGSSTAESSLCRERRRIKTMIAGMRGRAQLCPLCLRCLNGRLGHREQLIHAHHQCIDGP
jgi:hypothetical protein